MRLGARIWRYFRYLPAIYPLSKSSEAERVVELQLMKKRIKNGLFVVGIGITLLIVLFPATSLLMALGGIILTLVVMFFIASDELLVALRCSGAIAKEFERGTYELVSLTSLGQFGTTLLISIAATRPRIARDSPPVGIPPKARTKRQTWIAIGVYGTIVFVSLAFIMMQVYPELSTKYLDMPVIHWLVIITYTLTFGFASIFEVEQIPAINLLIGMITPSFLRKPVDAQAASFAAFIFVQIVTYGIVIVVGFILLGPIFKDIEFNNWISDIVTPVVRLVLLYAVREGRARGLWALLNKRLHAQQAELDLAFRLRL
jgi:hypothetical protein